MILLLIAHALAARATLPYAVDAEGLPIVSTDMDAPYPVDPSVRHGVLPNGLRWFVEENPRPARRAELRMVVRVGSVVEGEDERGIAHFLEHMAFNGSESFPADTSITSLEAFGARFGAHVNASTGFDETVYKLQVPTHDPKALDTALRVFADQAGALTFDPGECKREQGVVTEEWRLDQGLPQRIQATLFERLFHGSQYVNRMPIGTTDRSPRFDCDTARRFWQAWYRPDLMAVAVVGDVNPKAVERLIRKRFGSMKTPTGAPDRPWFRVPEHPETLYGVLADPEVTDSTLLVLDKVDAPEVNRHGAYREMFLEQMAYIAMNERLAELAQDPSSPLVIAYVDENKLGHERAGQTLNINAKEGREVEALEVALAVVERARRHGFTDGEIERARRQVGLGLRDYWAERDSTDSVTHVEEIVRVVTTDEPMPGIDYEYAMSKAYLPGIGGAEVNAWARDRMFTGRSRVLALLMPEKVGLAVPSEGALAAAIEKVAAMEFVPPAGENEERPLVGEAPAPGSAERVASDSALGTSTWRLSNGATVILKPTAFQADQILMEAFSPGGTSVVADEEFIPAISATALQRRSGLGDLDTMSMLRFLAGRKASVDAYIGRRFEGLSGSSGREDVEIMLQQAHLMFVAPRFDAAAMELERSRREEDLRNRASSPGSWLWDAYADLLWQGNDRYTNWNMTDLQRLDLDASRRIFRDRFSNPGDWTFVFVGSLTEAELLPLVETWIGSLPDVGRREMPADDGARMVSGVVQHTVSAGGTPRAHVLLDFHGEMKADGRSRTVLSALGEVLQSALREELREDRGGTYGVGVDAELEDGPHESYQVTIDFECDPERVDELVEATWKIVDLVKRERVQETGMSVMRSQRAHDRETDERTNTFWAGEIAGALRRGEDPRDILTFAERNDALNGVAIREMARKVLDKENYLLVVQRPESAATP